MSLHLPSRGALQAATAALRQNPSSQSTLLCARFERLALSNVSQYTAQRRTLFGWGKSKAKDSKKEAFDVSSVGAREKMVERLTGGPKLSKSSIFADEDAEATDGDKGSGKKRAAPSDDGPSPLREHQLRARDPDPRSRVRWQRKRVIRLVSRNLSPYTRESRAERIARTERELTHKGDELPISTKKLMMLARQISGKTVEDAIVQMRFSKKKAAQDLKVELEVARDRAVVERGMGLGRVTGERFQEGRTAKIQTKDKKWLEIDDPTRLYIDQAWVNKGAKRSMSLDYRARGRAHRLTHPTSRINLVLKEEKSRMRAHKEREQKKASRGPWLHLPNRPVTAQRPFYSW